MKTCITTPVILRESAAFTIAGLPHNTVIPRESAASNMAGLPHYIVIPAKAGIQCKSLSGNAIAGVCRGQKHGIRHWIPAFAGMTARTWRVAATTRTSATHEAVCSGANTLKVGPYSLFPAAYPCGPTLKVFA